MRKTYDQVMGDHKMLPQHFKDNGYKTLAVGKVFHQGVSDYRDRTDDFWDQTAPGYKVPKNLLARGEGYGGKHLGEKTLAKASFVGRVNASTLVF